MEPLKQLKLANNKAAFTWAPSFNTPDLLTSNFLTYSTASFEPNWNLNGILCSESNSPPWIVV